MNNEILTTAKEILKTVPHSNPVEVYEWTNELFHINMMVGIGEEIIPVSVHKTKVELWAISENLLIDFNDFGETSQVIDFDYYLDQVFDTAAAEKLANWVIIYHPLNLKAS